MQDSRELRPLLLLLILFMSLTGCSSNTDSKGVQTASSAGNEGGAASPLQKSVIQSATFHSQALDEEMRLSIYLPKGYSSGLRYAVLYLIHGYGAKETDMFAGLGSQLNADRLIESGQIDPLIIVSPQMDNSYGLNSAPAYAVNEPGNPQTTSSGMYEDYLVKDVVNYVDTHFSTIAERDKRYIGGFSMGGFVSLHAALLHSDVYSKAGGHSPALFLDDWSDAGGEHGLIRFLYLTNEAREERDPLILAKRLDLSNLNIYLDCGQQDSYRFYEGTGQLYTLLKSKGVQAEYHLREGQHDGQYWKTYMDEYLMFYAGRTNH